VRGKVTFEEVERQYRKRMAEYHPDKVANLGSKLRELAATRHINSSERNMLARVALFFGFFCCSANDIGGARPCVEPARHQ